MPTSTSPRSTRSRATPASSSSVASPAERWRNRRSPRRWGSSWPRWRRASRSSPWRLSSGTTIRSAACTAAWPRRCSNSCMSCAIQTQLEQGRGYITLELKVNMVRPITENTGPIRAEGRVAPRRTTLRHRRGQDHRCQRHLARPRHDHVLDLSISSLTSWRSVPAPRPIDAPRTAAGSGEVQEHERVERGQLSARSQAGRTRQAACA